ncbi:MAG: 2-amino-4-hydroxy-6-hydroxymethyldihydropteridine diphosphokinase [Myxococcota bacterium]
MRSVVIGVGSNLGSRQASIQGARRLVDASPRVQVVAASPLYETAPVGPPQPDYLNAAFAIETDLAPPEILSMVRQVEQRLGRDRSVMERWTARSLDLDILWDAAGPFESDALQVPHRELERRPFALTPLLDVAPQLKQRYASILEAAGGRLPSWDRAAIYRVDSAGFVEVESDMLVDACALACSTDRSDDAPLVTRHGTVDSSASAFADAINAVGRDGFVTEFTTVSHCSHSQWNVRFHGRNMGIPDERRVRLETTSGVSRAYVARCVVENSSG